MEQLDPVTIAVLVAIVLAVGFLAYKSSRGELDLKKLGESISGILGFVTEHIATIITIVKSITPSKGK